MFRNPILWGERGNRASCLVALFFATALLFGEDPAPSPTEIVVTATKEPTDSSLLTVPVRTTKPEDATTLGQALAQVPGIAVQSTSPGRSVLRAPTFGENGFGRINLLVDGVSQNTPDMSGAPLNLVPLAAVDHVESLSGPTSALYGDQSVVGALNVVTKVPAKTTYEFSGSVENTLSNTQSAFFGTPFSLGGFLLSAQRTQELPTRQNSATTEWNLWTKLLVNPFVGHRLALTASYDSGSYELPGALKQAAYQNNPDAVDTNNSRDYASSLFHLSLPGSASVRNGASTLPSSDFYTKNSLFQSEFEPRVQLVVPEVLGGDLTLGGALGGSYQRLDVNRYSNEAASSLAVLATLQRARGESWVSIQQNWDDLFVATVQVRYELSTTTAVSDQDPLINNAQTFTPLVYSAGLAWLPQEGTKLALSGGRTFRYPFLDEMVSYYNYSGSTDSFNTALQPETGWEATLSGETTAGFLQALVSASVLRMDNEILYVSDPNTFVGGNTNGAASIHTSVDATLSATFPRLPGALGRAQASADYLLEKAWFVAGPYNGNSLTLVPTHTFKTALEWTPIALVTLAADGRVVSSYYQGGDYTNSLPAVEPKFTYDASTTFHIETSPVWTVRLYGNNLSGDRTPDFVYFGGWYPTEGRTFGAEVKASY